MQKLIVFQNHIGSFVLKHPQEGSLLGRCHLNYDQNCFCLCEATVKLLLSIATAKFMCPIHTGDHLLAARILCASNYNT